MVSGMKRVFEIEKLPSPEHSGDWHDKPLRWIARCADRVFTQKFSTKRDAMLWASVARKAFDYRDAFGMWMEKSA